MDSFEELGITTTAQTPLPRGAARNVSEIFTVIAAGTAVTAGVLFALLLVAFVVVAVYVDVKVRDASPTDSCSPLIGCVP